MRQFRLLSIIIIDLALWVAAAPVTASGAHACPVAKTVTAGS